MAEDIIPTPEGTQPPSLKTADGVKSFMSSSTSQKDWHSRCDQVQAANGGEYPAFWFPTVVMTGLVRETSAEWGGTDKAAPAPKDK